jgi:cation transport regulator ChaB
LVRLSFEVPTALAATLPAEERDFIMEAQEWFEQFTARKVEEGVQKGVQVALPKAVQEALPKAVQEALPKAVQEALPKAVQEALPKAVQEALERGQLETMVKLCGMRLGRPLNEDESTALAERLHRLGEERVGQVLLLSSSDTLAAWLSDPNAQ